MSPETLPRKHNGEALNPAPIGEVLEVLRSQFKVRDESSIENTDFSSDLRYLLTRMQRGYTPEHLGFLVRIYGEPSVVEALRQGHGRNWSPGYLAAVVRRVASES